MQASARKRPWHKEMFGPAVAWNETVFYTLIPREILNRHLTGRFQDVCVKERVRTARLRPELARKISNLDGGKNTRTLNKVNKLKCQLQVKMICPLILGLWRWACHARVLPCPCDLYSSSHLYSAFSQIWCHLQVVSLNL